MTGERQPIISEDKDGTGFACDMHYEVHVNDAGAPLNSGSDLMLEGVLRVGYARVLELRKLNGKRRVPRLSVRSKDASLCSAVILPLIEREDGWVADPSVAGPVLVPLLSLGRRVLASEGSGESADTFSFSAAEHVAGGLQLYTTCLTEEMFEADAMQVTPTSTPIYTDEYTTSDVLSPTLIYAHHYIYINIYHCIDIPTHLHIYRLERKI